jgi:porin
MAPCGGVSQAQWWRLPRSSAPDRRLRKAIRRTASSPPRRRRRKNRKREDKEEEHKPTDPDTGKSTLSNDTLGLLPNPFADKGVKFSATYIADVLGNPTGGLHQGAVYEGRLNLAIDVDLAKLAGAHGLSFHANVFQIHGRGLSRDEIGNIMLASSIEALATTRLYEAWFEQKWAGDKYSIRAGQLAADAEFITSKYTDVFINATYGWPAITATNMPSGGPSPPLAAMGARLKAELSPNVTVLAAIFDGDAAGPGAGDPQERNRYGLNFRVNDPPLLLGEGQYAWNQAKDAKGLPGTAKLGGWYHAGLFDDQRFAANGLSQADPNASGGPAQLRADFGVYAVFEQQVLKIAGSDERGVGVFTRISGSPDDRNLIDFYADGGVNVQGPLAARPNDKLGLGFAYARISNRARDLDHDFEVLAHDGRPVRDAERLLSLGYLAEIRKGWVVHPSFQYIVHPGGGYVLDAGVPRAVGNAAVLGVRTVLKF